MKRLLISLVVLIILAGGGFFAFQQFAQGGGDTVASASSTDDAGDSTDVAEKGDKDDDEDEEDKPVPVETALASTRDIPAYFNATGALEARRQVELISKASGQIVNLHVEEGDIVKRGQVLLELEHREERLMLDKANVSSDRATRELDRSEELLEKGLDSDTNHEMKKELSETSIIERDLAQVRLDNKIVRAPFDGLVTRRDIELGQTVNVGMTLVSVADVSPLEVRLFLPEQIVQRLHVGQPVEIRPDVTETPLMGTVDRIAPAVDPATSTVKVTLRVDDANAVNRVGSFIRARVTTDVHPDCIAVPKRALVAEAGATYVFVAEADSVRRVPVVTGYADEDFAEITDGIALGDRVVVVGQGGLRTGGKIKDLSNPAADESMAVASDDSSRNSD